MLQCNTRSRCLLQEYFISSLMSLQTPSVIAADYAINFNF